MAGQPRGFSRGFVEYVLGVGAVAAAGLVLGVAVAIHGMIREIPGLGGLFGGGVGIARCLLPDQQLTNTSQPASAEEALSRLASRDFRPSRQRVAQVIDESRASGVNPGLILAIWGKEQSFGNEDKAFGYGEFNGKDRGFNNQLGGAISTVRRALSNEVPYNTRQAGETIFVMWSRTYTPPSDPRNAGDYQNLISFLILLIPQQVSCPQVAPALAGQGGDLVRVAEFFVNNHEAYRQTARFLGCAGDDTDCGRFVAVVLRASCDEKYPAINTSNQFEYVQKDSGQYATFKVTNRNFAQLAPGDILVIPHGGRVGSDKGHSAIYAGNGTTFEASLGSRLPSRRRWQQTIWAGDSLREGFLVARLKVCQTPSQRPNIPGLVVGPDLAKLVYGRAVLWEKAVSNGR